MIEDSWEEAVPSDHVVHGNHDEAHLSYTDAELVISWRASADVEPRVVARYDRHQDILHTFPVDHLRTGPQFSRIREIQFDASLLQGWSWEAPVRESDRDGLLQIDGLPRGFGDIFWYGLGIRRDYRLFMHAIEEHSTGTVVRFGAPEREGIDGDVLHLSLDRFEQFRLTVDRNRRRGTTVVTRINIAEANNLFLDLFDMKEVKPTVGRNDVIVAITRELTGEKPLDEEEVQLLLDQVTHEVPSVAQEKPARLKALLDSIELVTLEALIARFRADLNGKSKKGEEYWQSFFEDNTFALQQLFPAPLVLVGAQMHVAYADDRGVGGRIADFVLVNTVTRTVYVVEIKTPECPLLGPKYRGDGDSAIHPVSRDLAGAVAQVQAQVESVRTELPDMLRKRHSADPIETYSVKAAVVAGTVDGLDPAQLASLYRFRDGLHDVEVLTFDEVLDRLDGLHKVLAGHGISGDAD